MVEFTELCEKLDKKWDNSLREGLREAWDELIDSSPDWGSTEPGAQIEGMLMFDGPTLQAIYDESPTFKAELDGLMQFILDAKEGRL